MVRKLVKKQTAEQKEAFKKYYELGEDRSYAKVALLMKMSISSMESWGTTFGWVKKVEELDIEANQKQQERAIVEKEVDYKQRNLKIIKRYLLECAKAIQEGKMKVTVKGMMDAMREEERIRTGVGNTIEVNHKFELRGLSNEEVENKVKEVVSRFNKFQEIKNFGDMDDPIDAEYKEIKK